MINKYYLQCINAIILSCFYFVFKHGYYWPQYSILHSLTGLEHIIKYACIASIF